MVTAGTRKFEHTYGRIILLPALAILLATAVLCGIGLVQAGRGVDELSLQGQQFEAYRAIGRELDELSLAQENLARCDRCVREALADEPDQDWLELAFPDKLHSLFDIDETYILDAQDRPVLAVRGDERLAPSAWDERVADIAYQIDLVRGRAPRPMGTSNYTERLPGAAVPEFSAVRTSPEAVHASDLAVVDGRPAFVSAFRMQRSDGTDLGDRAPLLVNVRYLDESVLATMARQNFLAGPRFTTDPEPAEGEAIVDITTSDGTPLTKLAWSPMLPAEQLIRSLMPAAALGFAVIALLVLLMSLRIRRLMQQDEESMARLSQAHVELQAREAQAHHLAYHDTLTGLPNRALFNDNLEKALTRARHGEEMAVLLLDLDRFKHVNDCYGHLAGDEMIQQVARRLSGMLAGAEAVARLGGDEFAILLEGEDMAGGIEAQVERMLDAVRQPFAIGGSVVHAGLSIGIVTAPGFGTDRTDLMRKADIALYRAKGDGRGCYRFFDLSMDETVQTRATLEADLRRALACEDQIEVHYQLQVDGPRERISGLEALVRWTHPERGAIPPGLFIPVAEQTGLIHELGERVVADACAVARQWPDLTMAINLSPVQFGLDGFAERLCAIVREAGVAASQIELEVTESVVLDKNEKVSAALRRLRAEGFSIALDDFGTGYSSLSYLREFEVDKIKIDKSFIHAVGQSVDSSAIVRAVVTLGHAMGLRVTAEGVETADQEDFLRHAGCSELQGFRYSRAVPADLLAKSLEEFDVRRAA